MAYTEAGKRATMKYMKANYDRIEVKVPKGCKPAIEAHAKSKGESVNGLVNALLRADMGVSEDDWKKQEEQLEEEGAEDE